MSNQAPKLRKSLGMVSVVSLSAGAVIGGWLAESPYWFSLTGAGAAFIFPVLACLLIPVGLAFSEMAAMLPFASSVSAWTASATGPKTSWATQWLMYLIQVVEPPIVAYILVTALGFFFPDLKGHEMIAACILCVLWYIFSNFTVGFTGVLANVFFYVMVVMAIIVAISFYASPNWSITNITSPATGGWFPMGGRGIFVALAIFSIKFIGFEMTPTLVEEMKFPISKLWKVILISLFVPAALYSFVVIAMGGMLPWNELKEASMPEPEIITRLNMPAFLAVFAVVAGSLHAFTTLMGFWTSSARVLYGSAQMNQLPKAMMKLNRYGQPWISNLVVLGFSLFFCIFSASNWVQYIYAVSCIAAGIVYGIVCIDVIVLRKKHPEWPRPYKAPIGTGGLLLGVAVSVWLIIGSCLELDLAGYISLVAYMAVGALIYGGMSILRKNNPGLYDFVIMTPDNIQQK
jgi:APA family basic amino acid/polyamine antiporter